MKTDMCNPWMTHLLNTPQILTSTTPSQGMCFMIITTRQKVKGYSNPAGGHLTFISSLNLTKINVGIIIQVIKMYM